MKTLVVDANCFIEQFSSLKNLIGKYEIVTTKSVYDEIKDRKTIENLQLYLPDLKYLSPSQKSINKVVKFAKTTGDFTSVSLQDIELIALAVDYIREQGTLKHLKKTPA